MTAPTWAEARAAEEEARTGFRNVLEDWAEAEAAKRPTLELDNAIDRAEEKLESARHASDLALVREVLVSCFGPEARFTQPQGQLSMSLDEYAAHLLAERSV